MYFQDYGFIYKMENFTEYIGVFTQAPLAVILLIFIYLINKQQNILIKQLGDNNRAVMQTQAEIIKIIKQQERNK